MSSPEPLVSAAQVSRQIAQVLFKVNELEATLASYDASHAELLEQRLVQYERLLASTRDMLRQKVPEGMSAEEVSRNCVTGRKIPEDLVKNLDAGINPDEYLRETFKACKRDNQISKGKCEALQTLFADLLTDAAQAYPEESGEYRKALGL
ncbi:hypothetical protein HYH03_000753 [Edaphochlamys debaryana]|uniref:Mediator of RNA polymerase II transcription subunit 10 n=1 Tax=Edaphochlamys debaryana TaxID=47281 RepID=A0A835YE60_9CHLO|nr:hypothetical protein HYH03_000753 [Edaphochlamys debaryana]|eukprot:KAG2500926.1 hypothetical protein HYH03_000753 [Edaphochlamys debaryana]